jgi:hypothetical protein
MPATTFDVWSATKSATGIAVGMLLDDSRNHRVPGNVTIDLDSPVYEFIPEGRPLTDPRKEKIQLKHLLSMTSGIPGESQEAEINDGATYWGIYWNIMLPLSRPILSALAVFFFLVNWNSFLWPLTITTNQDLWVVQVAIASFHSQYSAAWNYIMAASAVVALPTLILFFFFQRQLVESIKTSGIK